MATPSATSVKIDERRRALLDQIIRREGLPTLKDGVAWLIDQDAGRMAQPLAPQNAVKRAQAKRTSERSTRVPLRRLPGWRGYAGVESDQNSEVSSEPGVEDVRDYELREHIESLNEEGDLRSVEPDYRDAVIDGLKAEIAALKRGACTSFRQMLRPGNSYFCALVTGCSPKILKRLWELYGLEFDNLNRRSTQKRQRILDKDRKAEAMELEDDRPSGMATASVLEEEEADEQWGDEDGDDCEWDEDDFGGGKARVRGRGRTPVLSSRDHLLITLRATKTGESQVLLGERFGIIQSTVSRYLAVGREILGRTLVGDFLVLPSAEEYLTGRTETPITKACPGKRFAVVDGTHFQVDVPDTQAGQWAAYSNYKGYTSQQTVILIDQHLRIIGLSPFVMGRAHEKQDIFEPCEFMTALEGLEVELTVLADKAYTTLKSKGLITVLTPIKGNKQLTDEEQEMVKVCTSQRVYVEHVIGWLKNFRGLFQTASMRAYENRSDGSVRDSILFLAAALYNAKVMEGIPFENPARSAIFEQPRCELTRPAADLMPKTIQKRLNDIPEITWDWLGLMFGFKVGDKKINALRKATRCLASQGIPGFRFGYDGRNSSAVSVGTVALPSIKPGVHLQYFIFDGGKLIESYCICQFGSAKAVSRCQHCLAALILLGAWKKSLPFDLDDQNWVKENNLHIIGRMEVTPVISKTCKWPPRKELLMAPFESAVQLIAQMRGVFAVHDELFPGGGKEMSVQLRRLRAEMDAERGKLNQYIYYELSHLKKPAVVLLARTEGISPGTLTKALLAWKIVEARAARGDEAALREEERLTCAACKILYFEDEGDEIWARCSEVKCCRWFHGSCEGMDEASLKRQKKVICMTCSRSGSVAAAASSTKQVFFEKDLDGPPNLQIDPSLSAHHVSDMSRGGRLVQAGDHVFHDDVLPAS